jgi:hypothetical protein
MRRTKHKSVVAVDHIRHRHITYGGMSNVDISVMEKDDGTLLVEVDRFYFFSPRGFKRKRNENAFDQMELGPRNQYSATHAERWIHS